MIAYHLRSAAFVLSVLFPWGASAAESDELRSVASDNIRIHVDDGLLTLDAHAVPLSVLLRAIGEEAGFEVVIEGDLDVPVDHSFTRVPLEQGLKRLLDRNSFMVFFDGPENMQELRVLETLRDANKQPVQPAIGDQRYCSER